VFPIHRESNFHHGILERIVAELYKVRHLTAVIPSLQIHLKERIVSAYEVAHCSFSIIVKNGKLFQGPNIRNYLVCTFISFISSFKKGFQKMGTQNGTETNPTPALWSSLC
jgi:hypothetical protein